MFSKEESWKNKEQMIRRIINTKEKEGEPYLDKGGPESTLQTPEIMFTKRFRG